MTITSNSITFNQAINFQDPGAFIKPQLQTVEGKFVFFVWAIEPINETLNGRGSAGLDLFENNDHF